jgi:drug/metabolite transporter (DMT)-like permease
MTSPSVPRQADIDLRAATILVACCAIWGLGLVMVKTANAGISPLMNSALRSTISAFILIGWARVRGVAIFKSDGTLWPGILCGILFALEFLTLYPGVSLTDVARATIFLHCAPFVAALGEHFLVPDHRLTTVKSLGLTAAFAGLAVALVGSQFDWLTFGTSAEGGYLIGDLLCVAAGIAWGGTTVVIRASKLRSVAAEKTLLYQLGVSAPITLAASFALDERGIFAATPAVLGAFAYTVIGTVVLGYTTWFWLMRSYSAARLHAFTFLTPIFGALAGHYVLGEVVGPATIAGLVLVAFGIWLVNKPEAQ